MCVDPGPLLSIGNVMSFVEARRTFALHRSREREDPAQLRTSVANSVGSGLSCTHVSCRSSVPLFDSYNKVAIDTNDEIEPWLYRHICIGIAENLEAKRVVHRPLTRPLRWYVRV